MLSGHGASCKFPFVVQKLKYMNRILERDDESSSCQGVGKTTLIVRVLDNLKISNPNLKVQGFYTSTSLSLSL